MPQNELEYVGCNLCGQDNTKLVTKVGGFNIVQCKNCGLVYTNPRPKNPTAIYYKESYYDGTKGRDYFNLEKETTKFKKYLNQIEKLKKSGKMLDVGCGTGTFLRVAQNNWGCAGVEISPQASAKAKEMSNAEIICGKFENLSLPEKQFDVITMWEVLEHSENPKQAINKVYRLLKNSGLLAFTVPNFNSIKGRFYTWLDRYFHKEKWHKPDEHLYLYTWQTLQKYLSGAGFSKIHKIYVHPYKAFPGLRGKIEKVLRKTLYQLNLAEGFFIIAQKL